MIHLLLLLLRFSILFQVLVLVLETIHQKSISKILSYYKSLKYNYFYFYFYFYFCKIRYFWRLGVMIISWQRIFDGILNYVLLKRKMSKEMLKSNWIPFWNRFSTMCHTFEQVKKKKIKKFYFYFILNIFLSFFLFLFFYFILVFFIHINICYIN